MADSPSVTELDFDEYSLGLVPPETIQRHIDRLERAVLTSLEHLYTAIKDSITIEFFDRLNCEGIEDKRLGIEDRAYRFIAEHGFDYAMDALKLVPEVGDICADLITYEKDIIMFAVDEYERSHGGTTNAQSQRTVLDFKQRTIEYLNNIVREATSAISIVDNNMQSRFYLYIKERLDDPNDLTRLRFSDLPRIHNCVLGMSQPTHDRDQARLLRVDLSIEIGTLSIVSLCAQWINLFADQSDFPATGFIHVVFSDSRRTGIPALTEDHSTIWIKAATIVCPRGSQLKEILIRAFSKYQTRVIHPELIYRSRAGTNYFFKPLGMKVRRVIEYSFSTLPGDRRRDSYREDDEFPDDYTFGGLPSRVPGHIQAGFAFLPLNDVTCVDSLVLSPAH